MLHRAVVPHQKVPDPPLVTIDEGRLNNVIGKCVDQCLGFPSLYSLNPGAIVAHDVEAFTAGYGMGPYDGMGDRRVAIYFRLSGRKGPLAPSKSPKLRCELDDSRAPRPGPKEVLMRVRASSLNYRDLMVLKGGGRGPTKLGVVLLSDGAGEVAVIGEGVSRAKIGDPVAGCFHPRWFGGPIKRNRKFADSLRWREMDSNF